MKRILLAVLVLLGLQTQAQLVSPCDSIDIVGSQSQLSMEVMSGVNMYSPLYMVTTTSFGYVLGEDSLSWTHYAYPGMAIGTDTITTCISYAYGVDTLNCCVEFYWNGQSWEKVFNTNGIEELTIDRVNDDKIYDLQGRELNEVPIGSMYIRRRKLYVNLNK
jgi:hypothetical protein